MILIAITLVIVSLLDVTRSTIEDFEGVFVIDATQRIDVRWMMKHIFIRFEKGIFGEFLRFRIDGGITVCSCEEIIME